MFFFPGLHTDWFQQGGASAEGGLRLSGCDSVGHFWAVELCVSQAVGLPGLLGGASLLCCWGPAKAQRLGSRGEQVQSQGPSGDPVLPGEKVVLGPDCAGSNQV